MYSWCAGDKVGGAPASRMERRWLRWWTLKVHQESTSGSVSDAQLSGTLLIPWPWHGASLAICSFLSQCIPPTHSLSVSLSLIASQKLASRLAVLPACHSLCVLEAGTPYHVTESTTCPTPVARCTSPIHPGPGGTVPTPLWFYVNKTPQCTKVLVIKSTKTCQLDPHGDDVLFTYVFFCYCYWQQLLPHI